MNVMNRFTWRAMWKNRTRTLVTIVGIILSAAMFTAVTVLGISLHRYMLESTQCYYGDYFVRFDYGTDEDLARLTEEESVSALGDVKAMGYAEIQTEDGDASTTSVVAAGNSTFFHMFTAELQMGRLPQNSSEIVLPVDFYDNLKATGQSCEVGDKITLVVKPRFDSEDLELPTTDAQGFTKEYQIVGVTNGITNLIDHELPISTIITLADGKEEPALWHRLFVKTDPPKAALALEEGEFGLACEVNTDLMNLYGITSYDNVNRTIVNLCTLLGLIIMVGSVSLIYNAFSISVSERTRHFGLLSSVGATKKQIRQSVYFEALSLAAIGIPLGLLFGYLGTAVTLQFTTGLVDQLLAGASEGNIHLTATPSIWGFAAAALVALLTVLISAGIPARRAMKVSPMASIRQVQDYHLPNKGLKPGKKSIWGFPGMLSGQYYRVSRKKYRAVILSLTISFVLFVSAACFTRELQSVAKESVNTNNFDLDVWVTSQKEIDQLRSLEGVTKSVVKSDEYYEAIIPEADYSEGYRKAWENAGGYSRPIISKRVVLSYLEDEAFLDYLEKHGIDPEPYFAEENPAVLVCNARIYSRFQDEDTGDYNRITFDEPVFGKNATKIQLQDNVLPEEVYEYISSIGKGYGFHNSAYNNMLTYEMVFDEVVANTPFMTEDRTLTICVQDDGTTSSYYCMNPDTGEMAEEPIAVVDHGDSRSEVYLGAAIDELPYGLESFSDTDSIYLVGPLSKAYTQERTLALSVSDYDGVKAYLDTEEIGYNDYLSEQMQFRDLITMINVFSYGFIILISLVCVCNVFNTVSTNISLRRRDFAMLRSVGIETKTLYEMMALECLRYGMKTLCVGLPIGILVSIWLQRVGIQMSPSGYQLPIKAMAVGAGCIFAVVFLSMIYGVHKMKKDNLIETIRMENQ